MLKSIPKPSFLDHCKKLGFINGQRRWQNKKGDRLYTWDSQHGEIEVFDKTGRHLAVLNAHGNLIKGAVRGRRINV